MIPGLGWMHTGKLGYVGVSVFFVLSGFIISYSYEKRNWNGQFKKNAQEFFWSRFARIYPLHWLMFLLALPLGLNSHTSRVSVDAFPSFLTLTDRLWPGYFAGPQPVKAAWTLSCEALFYLLSPLVLLLLAGKKNPGARIVAVLIGYTTGIVTLAILFPKLNWSAYLRVPEFLLGMAGFYISKRVCLEPYAKRLLAGGFLCLIAAFILSLSSELRFYFFPFSMGALAVILGGAHVSGRFRVWLSHPILVLLGQASFAFYLLHDPVLRYSKVLLDRAHVTLSFPLSILAGVALFGLICAGSIVCFRCYENPIRIKLRNLLKPVSAPRTPVTARLDDIAIPK